MDQGLAAVFGATVGVIGSAMTGVLTWAATRAQLRTQLQADLHRWTRGVRRDTYLGLLNSVRAARGALAASLDALRVSSEDGQQSMTEAWRLLGSVESASVAVRLEGPDEIAAPATDLAEALFAVFKSAYPWREGGAIGEQELVAAYRAACRTLEAAENVFITTAQRHLDIGGSVPRP
ncbi:hypothetical protein ACWEO4_37230 [Streptomyces sp. NPDC004393]